MPSILSYLEGVWALWGLGLRREGWTDVLDSEKVDGVDGVAVAVQCRLLRLGCGSESTREEISSPIELRGGVWTRLASILFQVQCSNSS